MKWDVHISPSGQSGLHAKTIARYNKTNCIMIDIIKNPNHINDSIDLMIFRNLFAPENIDATYIYTEKRNDSF